MVETRLRRDSALIDAIEAHTSVSFKGSVWRVVKDGRDPTQCSASGGRWDDGTFDTLYTSVERDGAIAEMYFHLKRGQPVFPSRVKYRLHEINASLKQALKLVDLDALAALGIDTSRYGQLSYQERELEYPRCQDIAEVAHFLDFDGLIVPNARWDCSNVVLFCDKIDGGEAAIEVVAEHGLVNWGEWEQAHDVQ